MNAQDYISVHEMARRKKVSDKRILQMLADDPQLKSRCLALGAGKQRTTMFLLPPNLLDDYEPIHYLQAAGFARAESRKQPPKRKRNL